MVQVKDIMTTEVVSVSSDALLTDAAKIMAERNFDGVPVVDKQNVLIGVLTEYDLISKGSAIHLPTFQNILQSASVLNKDKRQYQKEFEDIMALRVKDVMNSDPLTLSDEATFEDAVMAFRNHHRVNPIPIINGEHKVVGVVSRYDVLKPLHLLLR